MKLIKSKKGEKCHIKKPHVFQCYCGYMRNDMIIMTRDHISGMLSRSDVEKENICEICIKSLESSKRCDFPGCSGISVNRTYCKECSEKTMHRGESTDSTNDKTWF